MLAEQSKSLQRLGVVSALLSLAAIVSIVWIEGYAPTVRTASIFRYLLVVFGAAISTAFHTAVAYRAVQRWRRLKRLVPDVVILFSSVVSWLSGWSGLAAILAFVHQLIALVRWYGMTGNGQRVFQHFLARPAQLLAMSFLALIICGTTFLTFPRATTDGKGATLINAVFTATSATCVTGLAVMNTNDDAASSSDLASFSPFGQFIIFILIQVGGLGIMTLSAAILLLLGRQLGFRSQAVLQDIMEESSRQDLERSIRFIVKTTLVVEAVGALILFFRFRTVLDGPWEALCYAIFTSVSAYCNAGFSLWSDSLVGFREDWWVMSTIMFLITCGGLGFTVLAAVGDGEIWRRGPASAWRRWSAHVRLVLSVSLWLVVLGTVIFYYFDFQHSLDVELDRSDKWLAALFQSVTMRTAGFNTVDLGEMSRITMVCMLLLMLVGGSSGSTAGGVKTSTIAVVFLSVRSMIVGREDVEAYGRTVPKAVVYKSLSILVIFLATYLLGLIAMLAVEPGLPFESLVFETMSALATVGLSMGITPELSVAGKLILTVLMFAGRIGPLTLALAVGDRSRRVAMRYPEDRVLVG